MSKPLLSAHPIFSLLFLFLILGQSGGNYQPRYNHHTNPPYFTAVSSLFFRPGTDYNVLFTVDPLDENSPDWVASKNQPLQLKCVLMAESDESLIITSDSIFLRPGESGNITIPLPQQMPGNEDRWRLFAWNYGRIPWSFQFETPNTLIMLKVPDTKARLDSIFIQTDKPVYKPDDLVRIRVITMGTDDLPHLTSGLNITIIDSQRNVMKKWEQPLQLPDSSAAPSNLSTNENAALYGESQKKKEKNGLTSYEYQLSSEPILGSWTIQVEAGNIQNRLSFEVKNYILPKFQVKVHVPPVLYGRGVRSTSVKIEASYTYGKGLQGTGIVTVVVSSRFGGGTKIQQFEVKDGAAVVPLELSGSDSYGSAEYTITANVTEKNTGRWQVGHATARIYPHESYSIQWINKPSLYKPGFPITVQLKITGQDGLPVNDVRPNALRVTFSSSLNLTTKEVSLPLSGIATFTFPTPLQPLPANDSNFQVLYKNTTYNFPLPAAEKYQNFLQVVIDLVLPPDTPPTNLIPGNSYNFTIRSNKPIQPDLFHCLLWTNSAKEVHSTQTIVPNHRENATEFPFTLQIPKAVQRELKVLVYYETQVGYWPLTTSTSKSFYISNFLNIRVSRGSTSAPSMSSETTTVTTTPETTTPNTTTEEPNSRISNNLQFQPGDSIQIHFETYPDSTVAIRGIDQSLLLLTKQDNDLNPEEVQKKSEASRSKAQYLKDILRDNTHCAVALRQLQISVLNNKRFTLFQSRAPQAEETGSKENVDYFDQRGGNDDNYGLIATSGGGDDSEISVPVVESRLRTEFSETWLWEEFQSSNDSSTTTTILSKTLPDTLTSWIISGFSLNSKSGLGVANPATVTGYMDFFVTLNLPYSVIKDESFDLQVIVHNYLDRDVNVFVTLFNKGSSFSFVNNQQLENGSGNETRRVKVRKNEVALAHFVITPLVIGDIPIEVKVVTADGTAGDSMIRPLKVKPDGVRHSRSQLALFTRQENEEDVENQNRSREVNFEVNFPQRAVKGASALKLTVVGDPMGSMVSNLGHLLRLPGGCGEQNMARFVPNILALDYLNATNSDAKEIMKQAKTNLEKGYAWQLQYKNSDGSFAIYAGLQGTTWLTSYVLKWFVVAQKYITIDLNVIRGAINFLRHTQQSDGSFIETGPFYHPEMEGRTGSAGVALTAYIALAVIEANERSKVDLDLNLGAAIRSGMNFISRQSVYDLDDNYITNLVTVTLIKGNHPQGTRFFEKMEKGANTTITEEGSYVKYWDMKNTRERASEPLAIEMTSYALLAHLWRQGQGTIDISILNIQRWLLNQQGPHGGFISTQDTTMGLTALTQFALNTVGNLRDEDELQLNIQASSNSSLINDTEFTANIARWNRMVLQEFSLPATTKKVNLKGTGNGPALIQMTETWYMPTGLGKNPPVEFNVTAKMTIPNPAEPNEAELKLCINSLKEGRGVADSIASIELPSGYKFSPEDFEQGKKLKRNKPENVQIFELTEENTKLDVYYSSIGENPPTCINFAASQVLAVADAKSPPIVVYEYLNPDNQARVNYEPANKINVCQLCDITGACQNLECA